ncbi:hypothetical protein [Flavobacterium sp. NRK1]|uniref:hypothetical protein n=1 Tax=Flavobacterium sp. NRK1 TaxID=2954929 RepID=UPI0020939157|nr:hypothetical protein [Flavobacterium sp. NRK1]MCO6148428.1 hypothetical protein [Flavobacterium sp. NRK1]
MRINKSFSNWDRSIIITSLLALIIINYDFFVTRSLFLEDTFLLSLSLLLLFTVAVRTVAALRENRIIRIVINLTLFCVCGAGFFYLLLLFWGAGFTHRHVPFTYYLLVNCNCVLFLGAFRSLWSPIIANDTEE